MGHFGVKPIRLSWFGFVLPALLLCYFGQGALVLRDPAAAEHPFFHLAPEWAAIPLAVPRAPRPSPPGGRRAPPLPPRPGVGDDPARRADDAGDGDRVAGGDLRRVLA